MSNIFKENANKKGTFIEIYRAHNEESGLGEFDAHTDIWDARETEKSNE